MYMVSDVILNKKETIERCIHRIETVYANNPDNLKDYTKQDSIVLNIQRACESSIDIAMHLVSERKLGLPKTSRDAFDLMVEADIIPSKLAASLKSMVGFRDIAVHDYQSLKIDILQMIIEHHVQDFFTFIKHIET